MLLVAFVLGVPQILEQILEQITQIPLIAGITGTFESPVRLPEWANIFLLVATLFGSSERALRLRYNALLDGGLFGDE